MNSARRHCGAWGKRLFFLHDGRAGDINATIEAHASPGSEANAVIAKYNALTVQQKQDLLNFSSFLINIGSFSLLSEGWPIEECRSWRRQPPGFQKPEGNSLGAGSS